MIIYDQDAYVFAKENLGIPLFHYKHTMNLTAGTYFPVKNLVVVGDDEKKLMIFEMATKNLLTTKTLQKRASKMIYTKTESDLLITDKTGDVFTVNMDACETSEVALLMGHLSMITDVKLTSDEKYLITSDRDEKIRVSFYKNSYNIQSYLLGHGEFVTQIELIDDKNLVSVSGDSKVFLWDLESSTVKQQLDCGELLQSRTGQKPVCKEIYQFEYNSQSKQLLVNLYKSKYLLQFEYSTAAGAFNFVSALDLNVALYIDYFVRVFDNFYLFVYENKFEIKSIIGGQVSESGKDDNIRALELYLNTNIDLTNVRTTIGENFRGLFKNIIYSNVEMYQERKQERIQKFAAKRLKTENSENTEQKNV